MIWLKGARIIKTTSRFTRVNFQIIAQQVRVIDSDGQNLGVLPIREAREAAQRHELDLIEIVPSANPPVCKIGDFQKYKYEQKVKQKEERSKGKSITMKEVRLRYCTSAHDIETKEKAIRRFLQEKRQVRLVMMFKNRELSYRNQGFDLMSQIITSLTEVAKVDMTPRMTGKNLVAILSPQV